MHVSINPLLVPPLIIYLLYNHLSWILWVLRSACTGRQHWTCLLFVIGHVTPLKGLVRLIVVQQVDDR